MTAAKTQHKKRFTEKTTAVYIYKPTRTFVTVKGDRQRTNQTRQRLKANSTQMTAAKAQSNINIKKTDSCITPMDRSNTRFRYDMRRKGKN